MTHNLPHAEITENIFMQLKKIKGIGQEKQTNFMEGERLGKGGSQPLTSSSHLQKVLCAAQQGTVVPLMLISEYNDANRQWVQQIPRCS